MTMSGVTIPYALGLERGADGESRDDAAIEAVTAALANEATSRVLEDHYVYGPDKDAGYEARVELVQLIPIADWPEPYVLRGDRYDDPPFTVRLATFDSLRSAEAAFAGECDLAEATSADGEA